MSIRHIDAALHLRLADPSCKSVLVAIANHADPRTGQAWPAIETIELYTGMSERTIRDAIRRAERLKLIKTIARPGKSNMYVMTLPDAEPPRQISPDPRRDSPDPPAAAAPEPSGNRQEPTRASPPGQVPEDWQPSPELLAWAEQRYPQVDIEAQVEPFIRRNRANETVVRNIDEAFKGWLSQMKSLRHPVPARRRAPPPSPPVDLPEPRYDLEPDERLQRFRQRMAERIGRTAYVRFAHHCRLEHVAERNVIRIHEQGPGRLYDGARADIIRNLALMLGYTDVWAA